MTTEFSQQPNNHTDAPVSVNDEGDVPILDMMLDIVEDIPAELEDFIFLSRLAIFEEAKGLFEQNLRPYISFFPVLAEYTDMLLDEGLYADLTQLLTSVDLTRYSEGERNLLDLINALSKAYSEESLINSQGEQVDQRPMMEAALNQAKHWHDSLWNSPLDVSGLKIHTLEVYLSIGVLANVSSYELDMTYYKLPWFPATNSWEGCMKWFEILLQEHEFWEAQKIFAILSPVLPPETVSNMFWKCRDSLRQCPQTEVSAIAELAAINAYSSWVLQKGKQSHDEGIRLRLLDEAIKSSLEATQLFPRLFGEQATFRGRCFCEWLENLQMLRNEAKPITPPAVGNRNAAVKALRTNGGGLTTSWQLFISDIRLFFSHVSYIPSMLSPLHPYNSGFMDEFYPTAANTVDIVLHCILFVFQLTFLISLPFLLSLPALACVLYIAMVLGSNVLICGYLNKNIPDDGLISTQHKHYQPHTDECWIYLNGICVGRNWLQKSVDRLSRTFHRPVIGVHNKTSGIIFDLIQCLIQRAIPYTTSDIRKCYSLVTKALDQPDVKKVVLIMHSQGGVKGSILLDHLLTEVPQDLLQSIEVYTFGSLANHFNNPYRTLAPAAATTGPGQHDRVASGDVQSRVFSHIEHYANADDFGSRWGVLNFVGERCGSLIENHFMGTVFVNQRAGHQLNQHYLDWMFPLDLKMDFTREPEPGDFMDTGALVNTEKGSTIKRKEGVTRDTTKLDNVVLYARSGTQNAPKIRDLSRLWQYRNGRLPRAERPYLSPSEEKDSRQRPSSETDTFQE